MAYKTKNTSAFILQIYLHDVNSTSQNASSKLTPAAQ